MKVLYSILKKYADFPHSPQELAEGLTMLGFEVEKISETKPPFQGIAAAKVLEAKKHPNADRLSLCLVDSGSAVHEVVCGAPNVAAGQIVAFAVPGSKLTDGTVLKEAKIRGSISKGMICSEKELGLSEESKGIMVLEPSTKLGTPLETVLNLEDWLFDINVMPNRSDCLSFIGIARETSLLPGASLKECPVKPALGKILAAAGINVTVNDTQGCLIYSAAIIRGAQISQSPFWLRWILTRCGVRSINNIVDVTNYVMLETGQPLHAFDLQRIEGNSIIVRRAKAGETLRALDGVVYTLGASDLVIADSKKVIAIAGIMGGEESSINPQTKDIVLESAWFDPVSVRITSKNMGLKSESSTRFERGVDPMMTQPASTRASEMIRSMCEEAVPERLAGHVDETLGARRRLIKFSARQINSLLGTDFSQGRINEVLVKTGCEISKDQDEFYLLQAPSFRTDICRISDLTEEIARIIGYDTIPNVHRAWNVGTITAAAAKDINANLGSFADLPGNLAAKYRLHKELKHAIAGLGYNEALNSSFILVKDILAPRLRDKAPVIANMRSGDSYVLRPDLISSLACTLRHNMNHGAQRLRVFELGKVFSRNEKGGCEEREYLCCLAWSSDPKKSWHEKEPRSESLFGVKGDLEFLVSRFLKKEASFSKGEPCPEFNGPAIIASVSGSAFARIGELAGLKLNGSAYVCELELGTFAAHAVSKRSVVPVPKYPAVVRDIACLVDASTIWEQVKESVLGLGIMELESLRLFDLYKGRQVEQGKKSLAFSLTFRSKERTLTESEVEQHYVRIVNELKQHFNSIIR